jgi:hypothetical protein
MPFYSQSNVCILQEGRAEVKDILNTASSVSLPRLSSTGNLGI